MIVEMHWEHLIAAQALFILAQYYILSKGNGLPYYLIGTGVGALLFKTALTFLPQIWPL